MNTLNTIILQRLIVTVTTGDNDNHRTQYAYEMMTTTVLYKFFFVWETFDIYVCIKERGIGIGSALEN